MKTFGAPPEAVTLNRGYNLQFPCLRANTALTCTGKGGRDNPWQAKCFAMVFQKSLELACGRQMNISR